MSETPARSVIRDDALAAAPVAYPKPFEPGYFTALNNPVILAECMGVSFSADEKEHQSIQSALPSPGDATVTLTADETVDLTGIPLAGRKEIILNGHTLMLTGAYGVSPDAVLDIKPGEVEVGTINLTELTFDFGFLSEELPPEKALVEIRPGVTIGGEPQYPEGVSIREFPDILTAIQCD